MLPETTAPELNAKDLGIRSIVWSEFWSAEQAIEEFLISPIVAAGRQTAIYSQPKQGKSLLALDVTVAAATGRSVLGQPAQNPVRVVYLDLEMTPADLRERLIDLGYGPEDDLSGLAYFQLQSLPPLDTDLGGEILLSIAIAHGAALVVVDTMARAVHGEENSADTYRRFYAFTGRRLKAAGISLLRLDHQGKDAALGQRGSSAKDDDLDVVFRLTADDVGRIVLKRTRSRVAWVPTEVVIQRQDEPLRHVLAFDSWPAGTAETAQALDELQVLEDATCEVAIRALKAAGKGRRKAVVLAAMRFRKESK